MYNKPIISKQVFVVVIIVFFIGAGILPNIGGYDKKLNTRIIKESPAYFSLNNDFINAYWKFDECFGNTVGDSSGHNYDGTRHGATWTTDGYSGCALEFDGVNDYINLSKHSNKIGINKTDDFIISFYFKTESSNPGIIYSSTGIKNIPEFRIELLNNGSLFFKVWTALCGISLSASENLNNGTWHNVKIIFNGITTDPTIWIYINDDLEATITEWLCDISSTDFLAATIGKRASDETGFFEGVIDEFKFIKYEKGNKQVPPEIDGPIRGDPGVPLEFTFTTNDPEEDDIWIKIDWGNGHVTEWTGPYESGETLTNSYIYYEEGEYCIKAKSKDFWDDSHWSKCFWVKIGNQAPEKPLITGPKYGDPGQELTYSFIAYDFEGQDIYYIVDWDDGTKTETDFVNSNTSIQLSHSWMNKNDYNITAVAIDIEEKQSKESEPLWIRIGDQPPRKPDIDGPIRGPLGVEIEFIFTGVDPENDRVCFNIEWGDGEEINETKFYNSKESVTISHIWNKTGTYIVKARAKDWFGYWSTWETYKIEIPRYKSYYFNIIEMLFGRFPMLERLLSRLI